MFSVNRAVVRRLRITRGYSVTALAREAKCSKSTVSAIERGERGPSPELLGKLAAALDVEPDTLLAPAAAAADS